MWKLKEIAEGNDKIKNAKIIKEKLCELKNDIPEMLTVAVYIDGDIGKETENYDAVVILDVANQEDLKKYLDHPKHVEVAQFIGKVREKRAVLDTII
jgi:hypothetical protein